MIANIFAVIELILKLLGLWESFGAYLDKQRAADAERRKVARDQALDDADNAKDPQDAYDDQDRIVRTEP